MSRRATALGLISAVILSFSGAMTDCPQSRAAAADVGGYVVGAGLGLLLGSLLYRNQNTLSPSYYGGSTSSSASVPQPQVVYGWYSDGYTSTYGPIVVPPAGYVQPQTANPLTTQTVTGTIINPATGLPVTGTLVNAQPGATATTTTTTTPVTTTTTPVTTTPVTTTPVTATPVATTPASTPIAATPVGTSGTATAANINAAASGSQRVSSFNHGFTNRLSTGMGHGFTQLYRTSNLGTHIAVASISRAATSSVHTSAVHAAMQRVSRGSISMIGRQAGRHLGRMF